MNHTIMRDVEEVQHQLVKDIAGVREVAARKAGYAADAADHYFRANPWKALGIVAALAMLAGAVIARNTEW